MSHWAYLLSSTEFRQLEPVVAYNLFSALLTGLETFPKQIVP